MAGIKIFLDQMRISQWYKNLIVFIPVFFSGQALNIPLFFTSLAAFAAWCLLSSSAYIFNDILDARADLHHDAKKKRPIASGKLSISHAASLGIVLFLLSLALTLNFAPNAIAVLFLFALSNLAYSLYFKRIFMLDAFFIGFNFILRAMAGSQATGIPLSKWVFAILFFTALYLTFAKRHSELARADFGSHRKNLFHYSKYSKALLALSSLVVIALYALYCISKFDIWLVATIPIGAYVLFDHLMLAIRENEGEDALFILKRRAALFALWAILVALSIYGKTIINWA